MSSFTREEWERRGGIQSIELEQPDDLFFIGASFEDRGRSSVELLAPSYRSRAARIYVNREFLNNSASDRVKQNLAVIDAALRPRCIEVEPILGSWLSARDQFLALRDALAPSSLKLAEVQRITIDVTTFNRESLLSAMALLRQYYPQAYLRVLYASPEDHGEWLTRGFRRVRSVVGFPGIQEATRPTAVITLSGFEAERASKVIDEYEPKLVFFGVGDPPTKDKFLPRNLEEQKIVLGRQDSVRFTFPAGEIAGTAETLETIIHDAAGSYNLILSPMSTKLSTLGAFLATERHPELQIAYCVPGEYNVEDYSVGVGHVFDEALPPIGFRPNTGRQAGSQS